MSIRFLILVNALWLSNGVGREKILDHVRSSPILAGAHDRSSWLQLFAKDASVEDPVGTGANVGHDAIGNFWDAFIASNDVKFAEVYMPDVVTNATLCSQNDCNAVVSRWVNISTTLSTGLVVNIDATLVYEIVGTADGIRIKALRTYWPLAKQLWQVGTAGMLGMKTMMGTTVSLLQNLGILGSLFYGQGLMGPGIVGENLLEEILNAINRRSLPDFTTLVGDAALEMPYGSSASVADAWQTLTKWEMLELKSVSASGFEATVVATGSSGDYLVMRAFFESRQRDKLRPGTKAFVKAVRLQAFWDDDAAVAGYSNTGTCTASDENCI